MFVVYKRDIASHPSRYSLLGQNVGIGSSAPQCCLHVAGTNPMLAVGPYAIGPREEGRIMATGATAALEFTNRSLGSTWPANPQAGDRYAWYDAAGRARLWTDVRGDLVTFTPDGKMGLGLNHIPPANHPPQATLYIHQYYTNLTEPEMRRIAVDYYSNTPWAPQIN